jgi:hypothetical protein
MNCKNGVVLGKLCRTLGFQPNECHCIGCVSFRIYNTIFLPPIESSEHAQADAQQERNNIFVSWAFHKKYQNCISKYMAYKTLKLGSNLLIALYYLQIYTECVRKIMRNLPELLLSHIQNHCLLNTKQEYLVMSICKARMMYRYLVFARRRLNSYCNLLSYEITL